MLKIENTEVMGWEHAIRGMRNPKNSWENSISGYRDDHACDGKADYICDLTEYRPRNNGRCYNVCVTDFALMERLRNAGTDHRKFMRMITVYLDITAPLYWWKEFDTYKVGTVANSCSTMHKIHAKEFTVDDFSHEHLMDDPMADTFQIKSPWDVLYSTIDMLNLCRKKYLETNDKKYWWQLIQLLPSSYNQRRTIMLNYEVLANMYHARKNHKLDEWHTFCDWIETLPYSELITGKDVANE